MTNNLCAFIDTFKETVGGFTLNQMIAIGAFGGLTLLLGFFIGAVALYAAGIKKGRRKGEKNSAALAKKKMAESMKEEIEKALSAAKEENALLQAQKSEAEEKSAALIEEKQKAEAEKAALISEKQKAQEEKERLLAEQEKAQEEKERLLAEQEKAKEEREKEILALTQTKEALEKARSEARSANESAEKAQEKIEKLKASEAAAVAAAAAANAGAAAAILAKERKKKITLLTKKEILDYAAGLDEYLPANVYERGGEDLPDSCRVGICTFMLVYERKNMVKLVLRLHKKTAAALQKQFKLFTKAVYPKGGDWYKWILSQEVTDLNIVTAAVRLAYKYVYLLNYDEATQEVNVDYANKEEVKINEAIVKYQYLADRDYIVASDATEWEEGAYGLYGKKEMASYARSLGETYPVSVSESDNPLSPSTFKVRGKTFMMAYEKDGVSRMIFRASEEEFAAIREKHPKASVSPFPKASGYKWYAAVVDETFRSNEDVEEIIRLSCEYMNDLATR